MVLVINYLMQLKNLLQYKYIFLLIIIIFISIIRTNNNTKSIYNINDKNFIGIVESYQYKDTYITFTIKNKEKLKCNYYLKNTEKINIKYGDKLYLTGNLKKPKNNTIPNTFNYKKYLNNNDIYYILEVDKIYKQTKTKNIIYIIKNKIQNRLNKYDNTGYLNAFIIGNKNDIDKETYNNYLKNGIIHIFSISGMHISLMASIILSILNKIKKDNKNVIIVIIFLIIYLILTNYQASITRSIIFYIILNITKLKKIKISSLDCLTISILLILLLVPKFIYNIGFLYSSSVSFSLLFYKSKFNKNYILNLLYVSFISFLISLPITINLNYQVNILSIFINIIFVPLVSFILYPLSLLTFIFPALNTIFNICINITEYLSNNISNIDIFNITIPKLNLLKIIIYYILVYISLSKNKKIYLLLIIYILIIKYINILDSSYYVYFLDVGQGDMVLIKKNNTSIVIDTGPKNYNSSYNITDNNIKFMHSIGINNIDLLVISHGDNDHIGNASYLINNFKVKNIMINEGEINKLESSLPKNKIIKEYKNNINFYKIKHKLFDNENSNSIVNYLNAYNIKFIFMGDASVETELDIISKYNIKADIIKIGHHGSKTSSNKNFIDKIKPKYSIISVGENNRYNHPNQEVLDTIKQTKIYRTDLNGTIKFKIKKHKFNIKTYAP